ncbi:MAG: hypothetical protein AAF633_15120 [Chloroflexota bacterium]
MEFNTAQWIPIIGILLGPSVLMIGVMLTLSGFAPEMGERAKANIPTIFLGVILISVAGALATAFITAAGGGGEGSLVIPVVEIMEVIIS